MRIVVTLVLGLSFAVGCASPQKRLSAPRTAARPAITNPAPVKESGGRPGPATTSRAATRPPAAPAAPTPSQRAAPPSYAPPVDPAARTVRPSAPPPVSSAFSAAPQLDPTVYRLAPGDAVRVDVFNEQELSLAAAVETSGNINYPLLGRLQAAGMTVRQLEGSIADGLRSGYLVHPDVRVSIAQYRPIYITGQVRRVGSYPFTIGMTVERALAMAAGISEFGSEKKIYLQHEGDPDSRRVKVDQGAAILPGDTIVVEERLF